MEGFELTQEGKDRIADNNPALLSCPVKYMSAINQTEKAVVFLMQDDNLGFIKRDLGQKRTDNIFAEPEVRKSDSVILADVISARFGETIKTQFPSADIVVVTECVGSLIN